MSSTRAPPDAQILVYPRTNPDGWLIDDECGFWRAEVDSSQVRSLLILTDRNLASMHAATRGPFLGHSAICDPTVSVHQFCQQN